MAVFKRITCPGCGKVSQTDRYIKVPPRCSCGGETKQSDKWYVSLQVEEANGRKRKMVKAVSVNRRAAEEYEAKLVTQRAEGEFFDKVKKLTFERAADIFLADCQERVSEGRMQPLTFTSYTEKVRAHLLPTFRSMDMARITKEMIEAYKKRRMAEVKPATVNREISVIKRMCVILVSKGFLKQDPASMVELLRENNKRDRYLTEEEIAKLLKECAPLPRLHTLVMIALNTGLRRDGCLTLKWNEIDFKRSQISKVVKGGKTVFIPITDEFKAFLLARRGNLINPNGYVTPSPRTPMAGACMARNSNFGFDSACTRAGIKNFTFHDIRHTFSTHFLARTKDIFTLSQILGHSTVYMTERYTHLLDDVRREAMRQFGGFG